jgi:hypothetical protein
VHIVVLELQNQTLERDISVLLRWN